MKIEHEGGDELWDEFVKEFEKNNAVHEPSASERARSGRPKRGQVSRRRVLMGCLIAVLAVGAVGTYRLWPGHEQPATAAMAGATASSTGSPQAPQGATASPAAHSLPGTSPSPTRSAAVAPTAAIPLSVFPAQVQGFTRVAEVANPSCTGSDTVAPTLAGLITQSQGCLGVDLAMYKDGDGNEYSLNVFTMKDPLDAFNLVNRLGMNPGDYEVAVQLPPKDSGLRALPADSGLVQAFAFTGPAAIVGMAQWSDGRSSDFNALTDRLKPLLDAVTDAVPRS
ncbi:hypothetical protein ACWCXH_39165 [Kitasatospora sp. NPDC001660]